MREGREGGREEGKAGADVSFSVSSRATKSRI